jgi:predicted amidophosphoribosyltransferase
LKQRGYNQSQLLASELGKLSDIDVATDCLIRIKDGIPQARTTNVQQRRKNVQKAFVCEDKQIIHKKVMLIDDVCTSGATLESCAMALKEAGAETVWGITVAREI